jgi:LPS-assembly lipoprotein
MIFRRSTISRHPELVSGSIVPNKPGLDAAKWMLKQVQHDEGRKRSRIAHFAALMLGPLLLAGCGLQPVYSGGAASPVAQGLAQVEIAPIEGRAGWLVRNALIDRMTVAHSDAAPRYRLDIRLDDKLEALGVASNDEISRERRTLRARYQLVDIASGEILFDATAASDAGIDVVSSEYAVIAAEQTALENLSVDIADRIVTALSQRIQTLS